MDIKNQNLMDSLRPIVQTVLELANTWDKSTRYIPLIDEYKELYEMEYEGKSSPMNPLRFLAPEKPFDYSYIFEKAKSDRIVVSKIDEYKKYEDICLETAPIRQYFSFVRKDTKAEDLNFTKSFIEEFCQKLMLRYIYKYKFQFNEGHYAEIYRLFENAIYFDDLPINILVPINFIYFECEEFEISESIKIRRLTDGIQKARIHLINFGSAVHERVLHCATHAIVLDDYIIQNNRFFNPLELQNQIYGYPAEKIEFLFSILKLTFGLQTGYSQILYEPVEWEKGGFCQYPYLIGTTVRKYPLEFDNFRWAHKSPVVKNGQLNEVKDIYSKSDDIKKMNLRIAIDRLDQCYLRDSEIDRTIDSMIGLEALLLGDSPTELKFKFCLRATAILMDSDNWIENSTDTFKRMGKLYDHRSKIVHGQVKKEKPKIIGRDDEPVDIAQNEAVSILSRIAKYMINHPEYLDPKKIDEIHILDKFKKKTPT